MDRVQIELNWIEAKLISAFVAAQFSKLIVGVKTLKYQIRLAITSQQLKDMSIIVSYQPYFSPVPILPVSRKPTFATVKNATPNIQSDTNKIRRQTKRVKQWSTQLWHRKKFTIIWKWNFSQLFPVLFYSVPFADLNNSRGIKSFPLRTLSDVKFNSVYVAFRISWSYGNTEKTVETVRKIEDQNISVKRNCRWKCHFTTLQYWQIVHFIIEVQSIN